jgi:hypothetical protein
MGDAGGSCFNSSEQGSDGRRGQSRETQAFAGERQKIATGKLRRVHFGFLEAVAPP